MEKLYRLDDLDGFEKFIKSLQQREDWCIRFGGEYFKRYLFFTFLGEEYVVEYWANICRIYVGKNMTKENFRDCPHFSFTHVEYSTTYPRKGKFLIFGSQIEKRVMLPKSLNIDNAFIIRIDTKTF